MTSPPQDQDPAQDGRRDRTEQAAAAGHVPGPGALGPPEDLPRPGPGEGERPESEGERQAVETVRSISRLEESN